MEGMISMIFEDLGLWKEEEEKIHKCVKTALVDFIVANKVATSDNEDTISGELYPFVLKAKKKFKLSQFIVRRQIAVYAEPTDAKPNGYPDFGFFWNDAECDEHEYHIECKRLNLKKSKSGWNFCSEYVCNGVQRYCKEIYGRGSKSGIMIGYVQAGGLDDLLLTINSEALRQNIEILSLEEPWYPQGCTKLVHELNGKSFVLVHYWADFRKDVS